MSWHDSANANLRRLSLLYDQGANGRQQAMKAVLRSNSNICMTSKITRREFPKTRLRMYHGLFDELLAG